MKKYIKIVSLLFLTLFLIAISSTIIKIISEKFFFDKLILNKSTAYGYWVVDKNTTLENFGERSRDYLQLINKDKSLCPKDNQKNIVILGDSFTWGQGVRYENTFVKKLRKRIGKEERIYSFSKPGLSIFDHYTTMQQWDTLCPNNNSRYVLALVINDILPNHDTDIEKENIIQCSLNLDSEQPVSLLREVNWQEVKNKEEILNLQKNASKSLENAWENTVNICLLEKTLEEINKKNPLYILMDSHSISGSPIEPQLWEIFSEKINKTASTAIQVSDYKNDDRYHSILNNIKLMTVSMHDLHPSKNLHEIYADIIYQELMKNE